MSPALQTDRLDEQTCKLNYIVASLLQMKVFTSIKVKKYAKVGDPTLLESKTFAEVSEL